jgi:hypothetical protein
VKVTRYFEAVRSRPDRAIIQDVWIERAIREPVRESIQEDGRIRRWVMIPEMENRYLRVVLLEAEKPFITYFLTEGSRHESSILC